MVSGEGLATGSRIAGLEIVRAAAALTVIYNHLFVYGLLPNLLPFPLPGQFATEAVMIFFVLSGVVVTLAADRRAAEGLPPAPLAMRHVRGRLVRIYPILLCALFLTGLSQKMVEGDWMDPAQFWGSVFSLQSLQGYVVAVPSFNPPLWSLSFEVTYYLLFGLVLLERRLIWVWAGLALASAAVFYPPPLAGGVFAHAVSVFALSLPWLMGHAVARWRDRLPSVSPGLGICYLCFGLVLSRCPLSADFYDIFRLAMFSLACCPLFLALVQRPGMQVASAPALMRFRPWAAGLALILLWWISPSQFAVKLALTILAVAAAFVSPRAVESGLARLSAVRNLAVYVGSISYALYACHVPIMLAVAWWVGSWPPIARVLLFAAVTVAVAHLLEHRLQPVLNGLFNRAGLKRGCSSTLPV